MGHSTGCQDVMEYLTGSGHENREPVQGAIMQAGVSDREAAEMMFCPQDLKTTNALAKKMVDEGRGEDVLPMEKTAAFFGTAVCARRWLDLASPDHQGADDMFSSDLTDEQFAKTFGTLKGKAKLCILYGGNDEFVPPKVDKEGLVQRWASIVKKTGGSIDEENSGIIEGATHDYKEAPKEVFDELTRRVLGFLEGLEK